MDLTNLMWSEGSQNRNSIQIACFSLYQVQKWTKLSIVLDPRIATALTGGRLDPGNGSSLGAVCSGA